MCIKNVPYLYNFFKCVYKNSFFQHQQCNWADSCTQYPGQLVILSPAGLQTFLGGCLRLNKKMDFKK